MINNLTSKKILFCGSSELSIGVLEFLKTQNIFPHTIITQPARPVGRKKVLTETMVNNWAINLNENGSSNFNTDKKITILKPEKLDKDFVATLLPHPNPLLTKEREQVQFDLCLVASYGKILKKEFLDIFPDGVWNVHPSELPKYRGATPLQAQIIDGLKEIVVTVIKMDEGMDSGDILEQEKMDFDWEKTSIENLEMQAGKLGGKIFYENFGNQNLKKQNHEVATFTKILKKENGDVTKEVADKNIEMIWRKYNAYSGWPGIYFIKNNLRIKITAMTKTQILKLLPESKKEITLKEFESNHFKIF